MKALQEARDTWGKTGNITVGLYSDKTLENIRSGKDKWAATVFMNADSFSEREIKAYPYALRKTYYAQLDETDGEDRRLSHDPIKFYATDDAMAKRYLETQYDTRKYPILYLEEETRKTRRVL